MARSHGLLLFLVLALLIYGSVYPGVFRQTGAGAGDAFLYLIHTWPGRVSARSAVDCALNVLIYVPLGWIAYLCFRNVFAPMAIAATLSFSVEILQFFLVGRVTSLLDVVSNVVGAAIGVCAARLLRVSLPFRALSREITAIVLVALWLLFHLFPFIPALGYYRLEAKLRAFFVFSGVETLSATAEWMAAAMLMEKIAGPGKAPQWMLLLLAILPARLGILHQTLTASVLAGAVLGLGLWMWILRRSAYRVHAAAGLLLVSLVVSGLFPFQWTRRPQAFSWMPFSASFSMSHWESAGLILLRKAFRYGAAIWLLEQCRVPLTAAAGFVCILLAAMEVMQLYLPGRSPEIVDPLLALLMAATLRVLERAHHQKTR